MLKLEVLIWSCFFGMDLDPGEEPELDRFSRVLPLPYRVAIITVLGMRCKIKLMRIER